MTYIVVTRLEAGCTLPGNQINPETVENRIPFQTKEVALMYIADIKRHRDPSLKAWLEGE